jgi:hypothetical protein
MGVTKKEVLKATEVVKVYGAFFEQTHHFLLGLFLGSVPELFLPYDIGTIYRSLNIAHAANVLDNDIEANKYLDEIAVGLAAYKDNNESFSALSKHLSTGKGIEVVSKMVILGKNMWLRSVGE